MIKRKTAAILVGDNFHVHETYYPFFRLKEAGVSVYFIGESEGVLYHDYYGEPLKSDLSVGSADMLKFARSHFCAGRLFAAICHAARYVIKYFADRDL